MKTLIKNITTVLVIALTFTVVEVVQATAQTDSTTVEKTNTDKEILFERMETAFTYGLSSDVNSILESTFHQIIVFKGTYSEFDSEDVNIALNDLAQNADTHFIRYRAVLTLALMKDQDRFGTDLTPLADIKDKDEAFQFLNERLNSDRYTAN